jgi:phospho-N-acetylmuramoyl-pentapeptide-transferase
MAQALGILMLSFFITAGLLVPFINFLYRIKFRRRDQKTSDPFEKRTPIFDRLHGWKAGTPVGGGALIIGVVVLITLWAWGVMGVSVSFWEIFVLLFSFISFGLLGFYDDLKKFFVPDRSEGSFFGLRLRHKLVIQLILALIIGVLFYVKLGYHFIHIQWLGTFFIGPFYIFLAAFVIVAFANAFNITDGLDGLSAGLLMICLAAFWVISGHLLNQTLALFIAVWIGSLVAFLYFNVYPARIWLGDVGALAFGATLAVVGLLTGKIVALAVVGGVFVLEAASSLLQLLAKKYLGDKLFPVAPFHLWLQYRGWEEPKVVMRIWLVGIMLAIFGLWMAVI